MNLPSPSIWAPDVGPPLPALDRDYTAEIVVVGAGIAGLSAAHLMMERGYTVLVVDSGPVGGGMTQRTTAHISNAVDDGWRALVRAVGQNNALLAAQAYAAGATRIAAVQTRYGIACDLVDIDGYLIGNPADEAELAAEKAAATLAGLRGVEWLKHSPIPGDPAAIGLRFPRQARLHPLKYLNGLARTFRDGGGIMRQAKVTAASGDAAAQTESGFTLRGTLALVLATNTQGPFHGKPRPQELFTSYTFAAEIPAHAAPDAVIWDLEDPYHYVRLQPLDGKTLILIGGEDHKAHQAVDTAARFARLERWGRVKFPAMGAVVARWAGNIKQTMDNLGFMGRSDIGEKIFEIDGDGGLGFNHATIGALIIADLVENRANPWAGVFDPAR